MMQKCATLLSKTHVAPLARRRPTGQSAGVVESRAGWRRRHRPPGRRLHRRRSMEQPSQSGHPPQPRREHTPTGAGPGTTLPSAPAAHQRLPRRVLRFPGRRSADGTVGSGKRLFGFGMPGMGSGSRHRPVAGRAGRQAADRPRSGRPGRCYAPDTVALPAVSRRAAR